jgi:uncharacterized membrane protein
MKIPWSRWAYALFAAFVFSMAWRTHNDTTEAVVLSSLLMFATCWANAGHLMGMRRANLLVLLSTGMGWFAEQMGTTRGWFFGQYTYTDVLGWKLGAVPAVIPLMWFSLVYCGYVLACLIVWRTPALTPSRLRSRLFLVFLTAMLVTAFDLGADPYFVYTLKAWIMAKTDGGWFGETLQGFVGWMTVSMAIGGAFQALTHRRPIQPNPEYTPGQALLPLGIYGAFMVFQALLGNPIETRVIALFAMGLPLLAGLVGWHRWQQVWAQPKVPSPVSSARLAHMRYVADPLADTTVSTIAGQGDAAQTLARIEQVNRQFGQWTTNQSLNNWNPSPQELDPAITQAVKQYLSQGQELPDWADPAKIERAEILFVDNGVLSCTLLFCASLPQCYVLPDLSTVLHLSGQLEKHTEHRIRMTAAMIFPVMFSGGLTQPEGSGVTQTLKVRLIHAMIRHLILRQSPEAAMQALGDQLHVPGAGQIPSLGATGPTASLHQALWAHGWNLGQDGLPCNQEEQAYTLLTFSYVYLQGLRTLGLGLSAADEEAYLHTWNVVGHILGIHDDLMAHTMDEAQALFVQLQARGFQPTPPPDPRPALGQALMHAMERAIPLKLLKCVPPQLTRHLCGDATAQCIGVPLSSSTWIQRFFFTAGMLTIRIIDGVMGFFIPGFSLSRMLTRVLGYHTITTLLMDQTRPLRLPDHLLNQMHQTVDGWSDDPKAPRWLNSVEDLLTRQGSWHPRHTR